MTWMEERVAMKKAVTTWREQLGGFWMDKLRSFAERGYKTYYDMVIKRLTGLVESSREDSQRHTGAELMASAFGSGAAVSLLVAMQHKPLCNMVKIGSLLHSDDILDLTEGLLHSQYMAMMAFLVAADVALGQSGKLLEEAQAVMVQQHPVPVVSVPGVH